MLSSRLSIILRQRLQVLKHRRIKLVHIDIGRDIRVVLATIDAFLTEARTLRRVTPLLLITAVIATATSTAVVTTAITAVVVATTTSVVTVIVTAAATVITALITIATVSAALAVLTAVTTVVIIAPGAERRTPATLVATAITARKLPLWLTATAIAIAAPVAVGVRHIALHFPVR
ncbi:hypothetical protein HMPREF3227_02259 [Corynebacterium sp. CMW7794]|nr:hypothetical protein HMPREF0307_01276 [Corynebacterium sp. DNF00584]KXI15957.1 hypothetical protein HMPREF3227_02259 [Corynebacterium sp. CMW7794]